MAYLFILLTVSFEEQKFLILMKSSVSISSFIDHGFGVVSKKYAQPNPMKNFSSVFLEKSYCFGFSLCLWSIGMWYEA